MIERRNRGIERRKSVKFTISVTCALVPLLAGCVSGSSSAAGGQSAPLSWAPDAADGAGAGADGAGQTHNDATANASDVLFVDTASPDISTVKSDTAKPATDTGQPATDTNSASLSCAGKCGAKYDKTLACQCNDQCPDFSNCCADYFTTCAPQKLSCKGRCDEAFNKGLPCQCGWECAKFGTCCSDYLGQCAAGVDLNMLAAPTGVCDSASDWVATQQINDGDTFQLKAIHGGEKVRFLVVNTAELKEKQCYAIDAKNFTLDKIKNSKYPGKGGYHVCLTKDPNQPDKDKYGRLLRYVYYMDPSVGKAVQLNARLVRLGYGRVYYPFAAGNADEKISLLMQERARVDKVGGWGVCAEWK